MFQKSIKSCRFFSILTGFVFLLASGCQNPVDSSGPDTSPPGEISDFKSSSGDTIIAFSWTNPSDYDFDHLLISYTDGMDTWDYSGTVDPASTYITGLTNTTTYTLTIQTVDKRGNTSDGRSFDCTPQAGATADLLPPNDISNLYIQEGFSSVSFSWTEPSDNDGGSGYSDVQISYGTDDPIQEFTGTTVSSGTTIPDLNADTSYSLLIQAVDNNGNVSEGILTQFTTLSADPEIGRVVLDVAGKKLSYTNIDMQYSLNGGSTWSPCQSPATSCSFSAGDEVQIRKSSYPSETLRNLGTIDNTTGPDFVPGPIITLNMDSQPIASAVQGQTLQIGTDIRNIGNEASTGGSCDIEIYLSRDPYINNDDTKIITTGIAELSLGIDERTGSAHGSMNCSVPTDIGLGKWYIGVILTNTPAELTLGNNATSPDMVEEIEIVSGEAVSDGAFKVVNSWGEGGTWENKADGHYWITYESAKNLELYVRYVGNHFETQYEPRVLAVFQAGGVNRDAGLIRLILGDPANPVMTKEFQRDYGFRDNWYDSILSGSQSFPAHAMVMDISEFAPYINDHDVTLRVTNIDTVNPGSLDSFSIEYYSDYTGAPLTTVTGANGSFAAGSETDFVAATTESLTPEQELLITPLDRSLSTGTSFSVEEPSSAELQRLMDIYGVYQEGKDYNLKGPDGQGTGLAPPTREQWQSMHRLLAVQSSIDRGASAPNSVDLSATRYFPPIGNQGSEGSCAAFHQAYYMHTYLQAREHGWDLSTTSWNGFSTGTNSEGQPDSNLDKVFSPDFVYHQINSGVDNGSSHEFAAATLIELGSCTWQEMPYDDSDHTTWPSEAAFREAAQYRDSAPGSPHVWEQLQNNYFTIETDEDIQLLKSLLEAGYPVTVSVDASTEGDGISLYSQFDEQDVVSGYTDGPMTTNHAQTVVGYKEGSAWDPSNPDG